MKRSIVLVTVTAALGLAACTSTPAPDSTATSSSTTPPAAQVATTVVTQTVTNPPAPPARPVIGSFGYGDLKLGMTLKQALDAKLIGPAIEPSDGCSLHEIAGTKERLWVSPKVGVASISFTADMTADGAGIGATEDKLKAEYTNLEPTGPNYTWVAEADNNPNAKFVFGVNADTKKVVAAFVSLKGQDCHN
ncbi:hypothetical protein OG205_31945 [Lentzea sp. NBC_00516]|uniref:hypothetical protein n=1 Tax=Lentzea sp. NBC_00516 TaxID=2903582 RepID=UPI002E7FFC32|nr:hypothetical protein [Lentzea sp. NBC_00516]WUD22670.1 hypothetical protein OG205_31945 [Lentzea sp. NBC_00516]